jgi:hypothetical protein
VVWCPCLPPGSWLTRRASCPLASGSGSLFPTA